MSEIQRSQLYFDIEANKNVNSSVTANVAGTTTAIIPVASTYVEVATVADAVNTVALPDQAGNAAGIGKVIDVYNSSANEFFLIKNNDFTINGVQSGKITVPVKGFFDLHKVFFYQLDRSWS